MDTIARAKEKYNYQILINCQSNKTVFGLLTLTGNIIFIFFGPSEVRATSGQHLGGHYFA
jgi:hypothetical protein